MVGQTVAHFQILELLGSGGMGVVYRARDLRLERDVALKFLGSGAIPTDLSRKQFHREALALSRLNHPAIATVYEFLTEEGTDVLAMEFVPGPTLQERLADVPLLEHEVVQFGIQLAEGLAAAHRQGVIHRDLKPGNIKVTPDGRIKILDFGLARWFTADTGSTAAMRTQTQELAGTPAYMPPDVFRGLPASESSDIYALGAVLQEMATGVQLFPGLAGPPLFHAILNLEPRRPRELNAGLSPELERVILTCLDKDPRRRCRSAEEVLTRMRALSPGAHGQLVPRSGRSGLTGFTASILGVGIIATAMAVAVPLGVWDRWLGGGSHRIRSVAVLPLANISADPEQEYFVDGFTDQLIAQLAQIHALRVISWTSVMRYKHARPSLPQIARELDVDGVIEGSVMMSGDRVRITAQLIDARADRHLWAESYQGGLQDAMSLQSQVANAIAGEVQVRLTPGERERLNRPRKVDPVAYQLYLKGRFHWNRRNADGIRRAIEYFEQATARDSLDPLAWSGLADARALTGLYGLVPPLEALPRARAAALRAVAADERSSEAHASLGNVLQNFDWDWEGAEREYQRALALNPNNATVHHWYAHCLAQRGMLEQAKVEIRRAQELDPLSLPIALAVGVFSYYSRQYPDALEQYRRAADLDPKWGLLHRAMAGAYDRMGREADEVSHVCKWLEAGGQAELAAAMSRAYSAGGRRGAFEILIKALVRRRDAGAYQPAVHVAELYSALGQREEALRWLETAYREHDTELNRLKVDPIFDPLRSDPRFEGLLQRIGLSSERTRPRV